jgi:hypothetical protein
VMRRTVGEGFEAQRELMKVGENGRRLALEFLLSGVGLTRG